MSLWGPLSGRYEVRRPRKMLALDGGGIRGVLSLEILKEIERQLAEATGAGSSFRLCDFFDYIGGTSTGAIIAAGLARGMSADELLTFYDERGPAMFDKRFILKRWKALYKSAPLAEELQQTFGAETTLEPQHLRCLLLVVLRNASTDSPWPISSNPLAKYNDPSRPDCNLRIPLWKIVRASTAAPVFFPPEVIEWDESDPDKSFVFVDGGMTPYNNPAFAMYRMATLEPYHLGWETGEDKLMLVSVGTGSSLAGGADPGHANENILRDVAGIPGALMNGASVDQDINCRTVGRCVYGDEIDREVGDLIPRREQSPIPLSEDLGREFLYARYNAELSEAGLARFGLTGIDVAKVSKLDSVAAIDDLRRIGQAVAREVYMGDFGSFVSSS